jgi:hypothetical protein
VARIVPAEEIGDETVTDSPYDETVRDEIVDESQRTTAKVPAVKEAPEPPQKSSFLKRLFSP